MTRRHETLIPLTHDHHHALAQAKRLKAAAALETDTERRVPASDFLNFYFGRAVRHFHEEEELFFAPLIDEPEARNLILSALSDHLRMHALARRLGHELANGDAHPDTMYSIAALLNAHVRFEERELFPLVERLIPEVQLQELATVGRRAV